MLINSSQYVTARYLYDPFGNQLSQSGPLSSANLYRFSSKEFHPTSGLVHYLRRFYDPSLQRWLNLDPVGERGGINLYRFAHNDPVNLVDKDGRVVPLLIAIGLIYFGYEAIVNAPGPQDQTLSPYADSPNPFQVASTILNPFATLAISLLAMGMDEAGVPPGAQLGVLMTAGDCPQGSLLDGPTYKMPNDWPGQSMNGIHNDHAVPRALDREDPFINSPENQRPMPAAMNSVDKAPLDRELAARYNDLVEDLIDYAGMSDAEAKALAWKAMEAEIRAHANSVPARPMDPHQLDQLPSK